MHATMPHVGAARSGIMLLCLDRRNGCMAQEMEALTEGMPDHVDFSAPVSRADNMVHCSPECSISSPQFPIRGVEFKPAKVIRFWPWKSMGQSETGFSCVQFDAGNSTTPFSRLLRLR